MDNEFENAMENEIENMNVEQKPLPQENEGEVQNSDAQADATEVTNIESVTSVQTAPKAEQPAEKKERQENFDGTGSIE